MELKNFYTYAFLETPSFSLILPQGATSQVVMINGSQLSAIVEPGISLESFQNNDENIIQMALSHDRVICELFQQITVLPLRFGTYFNSQNNLLNYLESHGQEYRNKLKKINGKIEFALKLIPRPLEETEPLVARGRNYFLAKKQQYQNQQTFTIAQATEKQNLINLITKINQLPVVIQEQNEEVRIYLLVSSQDKILLLEQFLTWQKACPRWELCLGDCLPPYHFI
ncbi:GvpL/GvpF family gas vesicle protein [Sphaerospermopsis aphanizomenoides BCCUSP55]|uniref:GvpL/GvpF family gas vesicle protein n=1 Tax=Sphaerospermopsis aphanizomenoides TaxID=459663 RepID=UPI0019033D90|nr:GvpL/GvpF family gas vesicle protein [Sphaerospermopsis aphanizomenoides]MBK1989402.1 GvpL/GvpF family gas vesicle protein [Sphaerospermopsis aphanizomenoides BCCUSP55]